MTTIHRCRDCWAMVPADLQAEIYRTVKLRGRFVDASWAPWWRAQARAIARTSRSFARPTSSGASVTSKRFLVERCPPYEKVALVWFPVYTVTTFFAAFARTKVVVRR